MSKQEESIISDGIKTFLNSKRIFNRRNQAMSTSYGLPDREFLYKGISVGIEVKTLTGDAKKHQERKLKQYNDNGGIGVVVRSVEDVKYLVHLIDMFWETVGASGIIYWNSATKYILEKFDEYQKNNV